ncbi:MAG: hypothetical protein HFI05_12850 [Lachnospiraceae bacterium]|jgi:hypothetical protein|nr:hypothetical protein [Lachnospiraceae bacterium]
MRCTLCNSPLVGMVEVIEGIKYYGLFCEKCKVWEIKSIEKLPEVLIGDDKKIYKIMLIGGDNKKQLEKISGLAGISLSKAKKYLPIGKEIPIFEGTAEEIAGKLYALLVRDIDIMFKIVPEFPYKLFGGDYGAREDIRQELLSFFK